MVVTRYTQKNNCVVCLHVTKQRNLPSRGNQYESRVKCKYCNVHLCILEERNRFYYYHTKVENGDNLLLTFCK